MNDLNPKSLLIFDWGNTLIVAYPDQAGAIADWPVVPTLPHVTEVLQQLHECSMVVVATNAVLSDEAAIRRAFQRVELASLIDRMFRYRNIGFKKPGPAFFA